MKLEILEQVETQDWDANMCSLGGTICHASAQAEYILSEQSNTTARRLILISDAGERIGAAVGFQTRSPRKWIAPFTGRFWLVSAPVVRPDVEDGLLQFLRQLEDYARAEGNAELEIGSSASHAGAAELETLGFDLTQRLEFELDLEKTEEELFEAMEYKRRKNIRKAKRSDVIIEELPGEQGIAELRRLQGHSSERIVARGGRDITHTQPQSADPVMILLESGLGRIVVARVHDEIVSAGLFTHFNHLVYHTLSGHSAAALKTQAPTLLIWETVLRYKQEGARRFNFGGCKISAVNEGDPEHGVYVYKKAFGAECIACTSGHKILKKTTHAIMRRLKKWARR
jgi:GNAT acetyltransferase-like protein